ncbi:hypothetical protein BGZ58_010935 [Dissophora ornata]|nr:hypothetical protein BGZ58_010935 [Dissophora ornata]
MSTTSFSNNYAASISARRNQLHLQNSFGVPPNRFLAFFYKLKELTTSTDTTDEKITSTVLSFALISRVQQALNFYIDIGVSDLPMDPLKSKTIIFGLYIVTLIYCAISAFQIAEYDQLLGTDDHNDLLKLLYFVLITMSTIGYGDVTPKNQLGYAIVVLIIIAVVSVFPFMISGIMDALAQAKAGEGIFKSGGHKFMIISGSLHSAQKLANVLNGFWFTNKEYSNAAFKIVILGLSEPSKDIQALLQSARYKNRVVYLKGTPLLKLAVATATLILNLLHQHRPSEKFSEVWEAEYDDSLGNEFYISYLNPIFDGKPFGFVSWFLYRRFQVILFGVRIRLQSGEYHTALNPGKDYRFQHNEQCIFIAQNPTDLDDINELSEKYLENFLQHLHDTYQEDCEGLGFDYHAKNFPKAMLTLDPKNRNNGKQRKTRPAPLRSVHGETVGSSYGRRAGRYQLHSAMSAIANEDDDIDVEPEVNLMSETDGSGAEQGPLSPLTTTAQLPLVVSQDIPQPVKRSGTKAKPKMGLMLQGEGTQSLRTGYPTAPFAGAKVPLCILVDPRNGGERKLSDMIISSWSDVPNRRKEMIAQAEFERLNPSPESSTGDNATPAATPTTPTVQTSISQPPESGLSSTGAAASISTSELGHILVCSPNYDIFRLVCTLRSAHLKQLHDIVIMCSRQPNAQEFKVLKCFPRLYFLIGDCLSRDDLERGAITNSSKYLFMRHPENAGVDGSFFDSAAVINRILVQQIFSDAQISRVSRLGSVRGKSSAVPPSSSFNSNYIYDSTKEPTLEQPTTKIVTLQSLNEGPQCVYELVEERSVEFLQIRKTDASARRDGQANTGANETVMEGAGGPLEPSFGPESDSGYYGFPTQPARRKIGMDSAAADFFHNPIYASGGVLVGGLLDHVLYQLYSNPSILQLIKLLCGIRTRADVKRDFHLFKKYGGGCYLECIPVPEGFGVETIRYRENNGEQQQQQNDQSSSDSNTSDTDSSSGEDNDGRSSKKKKRSKKNYVDSPFSRAASMGKQKISELFNNHHPHSSGSSRSIDSDYMYDNRHKNFLHLYEHLALDRGVIPIGLLRLQGDDPKTVHLGIGGSSRCYAITNPLLDTVVLDTDQVFVLTREDV